MYNNIAIQISILIFFFSFHIYNASSNPACWIMLVMPTRSILPGIPCFLGSCAIYIHFNASMASHSIAAIMRGGGGGPPPPPPPPAQFTFLLLRYWLPRAKLCYFPAKSDRCDSRTRRPDGPGRYKRASMQFNTLRETIFLRLPRSYRVAEKSSQIGSREPNCAVFQ